MKPLTIEYIAGFVDGDGSIGYSWRRSRHYESTHKSYRTVSLEVVNTNKLILDDICAFFGEGKVTIRCGNDQRFSNAKTQYRWRVSRLSVVADILTKLIPYLRIKQTTAQTVLSVCEGPIYRTGQ